MVHRAFLDCIDQKDYFPDFSEGTPNYCPSTASASPFLYQPKYCSQNLSVTRSPFHRPAVEAPALQERPNSLDLCVPSFFVTGDRVANGESFHGRSLLAQTTTTDYPPYPRRRKRSSRRSRKTRVGFRVAVAS